MPLVLGIAGLGLSAIFGITALLDRLDQTNDDLERSAINFTALCALGFGIWLTVRNFKK